MLGWYVRIPMRIYICGRCRESLIFLWNSSTNRFLLGKHNDALTTLRQLESNETINEFYSEHRSWKTCSQCNSQPPRWNGFTAATGPMGPIPKHAKWCKLAIEILTANHNFDLKYSRTMTTLIAERVIHTDRVTIPWIFLSECNLKGWTLTSNNMARYNRSILLFLISIAKKQRPTRLTSKIFQFSSSIHRWMGRRDLNLH